MLEYKGETQEREPRATPSTLPVPGSGFGNVSNSLQSSNKEDKLVGNRINEEEEDYGKAVKADNAKVNVDLWDKQCSQILGLEGGITVQLQAMTKLLHKSMFAWWRRKVTKECVQMLKQRGWDR